MTNKLTELRKNIRLAREEFAAELFQHQTPEDLYFSSEEQIFAELDELAEEEEVIVERRRQLLIVLQQLRMPAVYYMEQPPDLTLEPE